MRKISNDIVTAFLAGNNRTISNSSTNGKSLFLHGNEIARVTDSGIEITLAGWPTPTTRERLNAICEKLGVGKISQRKGKQYRDGQEIDPNLWYSLKTNLQAA